MNIRSVNCVKIDIEKVGDWWWATAFAPSIFGYCSANGTTRQAALHNFFECLVEQLDKLSEGS